MKFNDYLTVKQAAEYLGVARGTLRHWERQNKIKSHRSPMSNYRLYKKEELQEILDQIKKKL